MNSNSKKMIKQALVHLYASQAAVFCCQTNLDCCNIYTKPITKK